MEDKKSISDAIMTTNILIARRISQELKLQNFEVSPAQIRIVEYLSVNKDKKIYQKDIERLFKIRRSTVSGILKTMEKNDIIRRVDSLVDARSKEIILTDWAFNKALSIRNSFKGFDKVLCKDIGITDLEIFFKVICKINDNIINEGEDY